MPRARYRLGEGITRPCHAQPYDPYDWRLKHQREGAPPDPVHRVLTVYTQDPSALRMDVPVAQVRVPYEPLAPGPSGCVLRVIDQNFTTEERYEPLDLDALKPGPPGGLRPSTMDPRFAQQMVYAVAMATYERFRAALGRLPDFAFEPHAESGGGCEDKLTLRVYPHAREIDNAWYDRRSGALMFGYTFAAPAAAGLNQAGGIVFTSLSHDVVVHEVTHALLDGMRAAFLVPTNPDVEAFHEGFADLVALFQRYQYRELVVRGLAERGDVTSRLLTELARQWGETRAGGRGALRSALLATGGPDDPLDEAYLYCRATTAHERGAVLVAAVFDAFRWIFDRRTKRLRRLHSRPGPCASDLVELLTDQATKLASHFLNIVIRAVDYCPPVDLTFGEYLRAVVTADFDLVPEDPWGYREAFVRAFRRYGVPVEDVADLSEDALLWQPPERFLGTIPGLDFPSLRHGREPGQIGTPEELHRRADALGEFVTRSEHLYYFGLVAPRRSRTRPIEPPVVESVRTLRRIGPDGTLNFDLVAEVLQRRRAAGGVWFHGGSTVIIDSDGSVRYAINKFAGSTRREARVVRYMTANPDGPGRQE